ncbi:MAG: SEL1-like repeat protein [Betaproteobacteria bacterium]|nr:SEL1-like repeat protein [Betaproteobacteria bacterium]
MAQSNLGVMYEKGRGVPQSKVVAYALYDLSAEGDPSEANGAAKNRAALAEFMSGKAIDIAHILARQMTKPGYMLKTLDQYVKHPIIKEVPNQATCRD